ncbi:TBC1 domain family member 1-like isoform X2 [Liolophura sinensis]|uniref:TBC1 domain family member 1-like isoform X2 n=1 Tax=Liolophura sinensis TaxID=3198878 RepID=UPI003158E56A
MEDLCQNLSSIDRAEDSGVFMSGSTTDTLSSLSSPPECESYDSRERLATNPLKTVTAEMSLIDHDKMKLDANLGHNGGGHLNIISEMEEDNSHGEEKNDGGKLYSVIYMGYAELDRRYTQTVMPWVMAEVKRRKQFQEVNLEVTKTTLRGITKNTTQPEIVFDHRLHSLSRFARMFSDRSCFGYLTRQQLHNNFQCHVFIAEEEDMVPDLFQAIRDATQEASSKRPGIGTLWDDMAEDQCTAKAFYEVLYIGRVIVHGEKITSHYVDDLAEKFESKEPDLQNNTVVEEAEKRNRHASGASVKSLPANLEGSVTVTENDLGRQHEKLGYGDGSVDSSADDILGSGQIGGSSTEILDGSGSVHSNDASASCPSQDSIDGPSSTPRLSQPCTDVSNLPTQGNGTHVQLPVYSKADRNRTMLFRLGQNEITLISPDLKSSMLERKFKDIPSVSQGSKKKDVFGFITREAHHVFVCHLLKCHSKDLVDDVMTALRVAFTSAYEHNKLQICTMCPLHQLHKLCLEIEGLSPQNAYELVIKRIQQLPEKDTTEIMAKYKLENPQTFSDMVEVLMIQLRKLCELKQKEHTHISDSNRYPWRHEFNIMDIKLSSKSKFDSFRNKAKKSLTSSFENLLSRGRKNSRDESKETFRNRSSTLDSEGSVGLSRDSSNHSTPEESPIPSPVNKDAKEQFGFPSPTHSPKPVQRARSSTVGSLPKTGRTLRKHSLPAEKLPLESRGDDTRRASTSSSTSPMRHMFMIAGSGGCKSASVRNQSSGDDVSTVHLTPGGRRGSWRQAIFNRVVSPVHAPDTLSLDIDVDPENPSEPRKLSPQTIRCMWKKAILETLLLIRMEKENQNLRARQDEMQIKRLKLDYTEITPGNLAEVLRVWDEILNCPDPSSRPSEATVLLNSVKIGVPRTKRGEVWQYLVEQHQHNNPSLAALNPTRNQGVGYEDLLKQLTTHQHAILIDLGRTFPGHPYFSPQLGPGQLALFNLLKAYSLLDKEVGYCQGLSFVAGVLLMHMEETVAFETMKYLMFELGLRKQYRPDMMALQIKLYQLTRLIHDNEKDLYDHFEANEIVPTLYAAPWFLTLFASQFPLGFVARVFDLIFIQGIDVIFKVAMVLLGNHKELIKQCDSFETIVEFLKTTLPEMGIIQMERVINQVFDLDISKQLQAYEVEYHVLQEEMLSSPQKGENDMIHKLEQANRNLKRQNMELLEKLQHANSQNHSLEIVVHNCQTNEAKFKSHIRTLEIERAALLNAVTKLRHLIPEDVIAQANLMLPPISDTWPTSPVHNSPSSHTHSKSASHRSPVAARSPRKDSSRSSPHSSPRSSHQSVK